jgi:hypothetical protein
MVSRTGAATAYGKELLYMGPSAAPDFGPGTEFVLKVIAAFRLLNITAIIGTDGPLGAEGLKP